MPLRYTISDRHSKFLSPTSPTETIFVYTLIIWGSTQSASSLRGTSSDPYKILISVLSMPKRWQVTLKDSLTNPKHTSNMCVCGLAPETTDSMLYNYGIRFGPIRSAKGICEFDSNICKGKFSFGLKPWIELIVTPIDWGLSSTMMLDMQLTAYVPFTP